jgi:hypothetical protein
MGSSFARANGAGKPAGDVLSPPDFGASARAPHRNSYRQSCKASLSDIRIQNQLFA